MEGGEIVIAILVEQWERENDGFLFSAWSWPVLIGVEVCCIAGRKGSFVMMDDKGDYPTRQQIERFQSIVWVVRHD